jgi:UDP-glucose 4-epimerase
MRILITGARGLVGSRIAQHLVQRGHLLRLGSRRVLQSKLSDQIELVPTDWDDEKSLYAACLHMDAVIHAAGMNASEAIEDPVGAFTINCLGSARLANAARRAGVGRVLYFSSAHVYASPLTGKISEGDCPMNLHPYASSHLAGEFAMRQASQENDIQVLALRLSNAFGAPIEAQANCWRLLANDLCRQVAETGKMHLATSGQQWRDFIPLTAVCEVVARILESGKNLNAVGVLNLGGSALRVIEMAKLIQARAGALFGHMPTLERPSTTGANDYLPIDYRCDRLIRFIGAPVIDINSEIDGLLQYCCTHFGIQRAKL